MDAATGTGAGRVVPSGRGEPDAVHRVVRVDRGGVLVVPEADLLGVPEPTAPEAGLAGTPQPTVLDPRLTGTPDRAEPRRAMLDRDGLVPDGAGGRVAPTVGDRVLVDELPGTGLTTRVVLERRTLLVRDSAGSTSRVQPLAANVDIVLVVEHLDPEPALGRVERLLTLVWRSGARPVVALTKADLVPDPDGMAAEVATVAIGADVHAVSAADGSGLDPVRALLTPGTTLVVVGPSGAGKSTLVNALAGAEVMATGERRADGRGRHTTVHRELVALPGGALLVDTPGLRGVGVVADAGALSTTFADIEELAARCRFADCAHEREPDCAVQAALASGELPERRYTSWFRLAREAARQAARSDARLAAEERTRRKRTTVDYHRHQRAGAPRR